MKRVELKRTGILAESSSCAIRRTIFTDQPVQPVRIKTVPWSSPEFQHISCLLTGFEVTGLRPDVSVVHPLHPYVGYPGLPPVFPIWESFSVVGSAGSTFSLPPDPHSWITFNLFFVFFFLKTMLSSQVFLPLLVKVVIQKLGGGVIS